MRRRSRGGCSGPMQTRTLFWTEWLPLTVEQTEHLSEVAGLYEVKVERRLVDYPTGRSAMVYYGCTGGELPGLRTLVREDWFSGEKEAIRARWADYGALVFRWAATGDPAPEHERRLRLFRERFGRAPWGNPET